jgi:hypothetical protein
MMLFLGGSKRPGRISCMMERSSQGEEEPLSSDEDILGRIRAAGGAGPGGKGHRVGAMK